MSQSALEDARRLVGSLLAKDPAVFEARELDEIPGAVYVYEPTRGGAAAIVLGESFLFAASGIARADHVREFKAGRRSSGSTDPS